jgi:hypothetical protein
MATDTKRARQYRRYPTGATIGISSSTWFSFIESDAAELQNVAAKIQNSFDYTKCVAFFRTFFGGCGFFCNFATSSINKNEKTYESRNPKRD